MAHAKKLSVVNELAKLEQMEMPEKVQTYLPIEDHGVIGDLHTVALVGKNGTIDWWCTPAFDSPSVFAAILDAQKGGSFSISPIDLDRAEIKQYYFPETNILVTRFLSEKGVSEITDFMSVRTEKERTTHHEILRSARVVSGRETFVIDCRPAFNYARDTHSLNFTSKGAVFDSKDLSLGLSSTVTLKENGKKGAQGKFTLNKDELAYFLLQSGDPDKVELRTELPDISGRIFNDTRDFWRNWVQHITYRGRWREMVVRSALTLKMLTYQPTGALVAAPTTSLPEGMGGSRNWDYRFTWLRDSVFTLNSLLRLGLIEEGTEFARWFLDRIAESPDGRLQPMFTIEGGHQMDEYTLDHLEGYRKSRPVRIGNEAYKQQQLDVYGEVLDAAYLFTRKRGGAQYRGYQSTLRVMDWLTQNWQQTDEGIWEVRGGQREFLHSRLMEWVAFDRAIKIFELASVPAPLEKWRGIRDTLYNEIMEKGWNEKKQSFVQYFGGDAIDASALLLSITGFVTGFDERMIKTINRMEKELMNEPHLYRYRVDAAASDGLAGTEGTFSICSFWLVEALTNAGRLEEARRYLEELFTYSNHLGLYSEEIGPTGEDLGNFPQAFTHLALINSCLALDAALTEQRIS